MALTQLWGADYKVMNIAPNMKGEAAEIDEPERLLLRIGYRIYLMQTKDNPPIKLYEGFNRTDVRRLAELARAPSE